MLERGGDGYALATAFLVSLELEKNYDGGLPIGLPKQVTTPKRYLNESVHDSNYGFTVDGDKLTLIGGEGTIGGTYELTKQKE